MKVAIITLFGDNYGNKLQNYAMQSLLERLGCEVCTIPITDGQKLHQAEDAKAILVKFKPSYMTKVAQSRFNSRYRRKNQRDGFISAIRFSRKGDLIELNEKRHASFSSFADEHIHLDERVYQNGCDLENDYEAYVCGSDQIWNPNYSSTSAECFLQFAPKYKRIAFAPSFGLSKLPESLKPIYKKWLEEIPQLSIREDSGAAIIRELTGREVPVLPDPTLCLTAEQWEKIEKKPTFAEGEYVLTYFLGNETNKYRRYIEAYAKEREIRIIDLLDLREPAYYAADPAEFLWLFRHARAVFTDSFHGTVFSLLFHTPFVVFDRMESGGTSMGSRLETLLRMTEMENRRFGQVAVPAVEDIDFTASDAAIVQRAAAARTYLKEALDSVASFREAPEPVPDTVLPNKADCSGCGACCSACPVQCIQMVPDSEGFRYPVIDLNACVHCDRCRTVCASAEQEKADGTAEAYIAYSKDVDLRAESSSGGAFTVLARQTLLRGGFVYGAGFNDAFRVVHQCVGTEEELNKLRGSKYVQSDMTHAFEEIQNRLEDGSYVYFSGTPCQVDGLLSYLGQDYEKLITQDIICHGVPSPEVWEAYLALRCGDETVQHVSFRDKTYGWHYFSMRIDTSGQRYIKRLDEDVYTRLFLDNVILRPSCYACRHKHLHRKSDITLGDCWSIDSMRTDLKDDDRGLSLLFANTTKGKKLLEEVMDSLEMTPVDFEQATNSQTAMTKSVRFNPQREVFFANVKANGMEQAVREWYGWTLPNDLKRSIVYLKTQIRKLIR